MLLLLSTCSARTIMNQEKIQIPITQLLQQWRAGDDRALDRLTPAVYGELKRLAMAFMRRERPGHTLKTGDLVHEAFVRMIGERERNFENRLHFFALASKIMKDFLIQYARARNAQKRGGDLLRVTLGGDDKLSDDQAGERIVFLTESIETLTQINTRAGRILELFYYVGLGVQEIAEIIKIAPATVKRDLHFARTWLKKRFAERTS
ncbi:MAG: sigma-70 family RNA polymerase sigma factor [Acidobacteriota bacterium]|nr:sigma-70 family RNA polymerase sigma factor [Acidobacteriota bacterium]